MTDNMNNPQNNGFGGQTPPFQANNGQQNNFGGQFPPFQANNGTQFIQIGRTNTLAIVAILTAFLCWPVGLVTGIMARRQIAQTGEAGGGMALAAIIIGVISAVFTVILLVAVVFAANHAIHLGGQVSGSCDPSMNSTMTVNGTTFTCINGTWQ